MSELRWNPLLRTWTMVASNRKLRPTMPKDWCPFCPGNNEKVPDDYDVLKYDNDFPVLTQAPEASTVASGELYKTMENYGKCEVILYSPQHTGNLYDLSTSHILKMLNLLVDRFNELKKDERVKYIFPFENKGEEVGVTMPHPHGQLYAYPFVPQKIRVELDSCREYYEANGSNLFEAMNKEEVAFEKRLVGENDSFLAYIPFFTDYPYGVFIVAKRQVTNLAECTEKEREDLAEMLKILTKSFDLIFERPFPYMMVYHQSPVNTPEYEGASEYYRFHMEFYPPLREAQKIKFYASSEMGAWAAANTNAVEETAPILRKLYEQTAKEIIKE